MKKHNTKIALFLAVVILACQIARGINLKIEHFEDGAGRITYCLPYPFGICD